MDCGKMVQLRRLHKRIALTKDMCRNWKLTIYQYSIMDRLTLFFKAWNSLQELTSSILIHASMHPYIYAKKHAEITGYQALFN
jgi:hypothetical protein